MWHRRTISVGLHIKQHFAIIGAFHLPKVIQVHRSIFKAENNKLIWLKLEELQRAYTLISLHEVALCDLCITDVEDLELAVHKTGAI